jgi:catechol 2,3-dioxygenase-like lactoylglutathione lyase family enzyme
MKYVCALMAVSDMERSRAFYTGLLDQTVKFDFGANVAFEAGFAIHRQDHFSSLLDGRPVRTGGNDAELYFEHDDVAEFVAKLSTAGVELVHAAREQPWRQLVVRFYDPDRHIIEVGESMEHLVRRLRASGMEPDGISQATGMPTEFIAAALA